MLSSSLELKSVFEIAPEWEPLLRNWDGAKAGAADFLQKVGPKAIYKKILGLGKERERFLMLLRDYYFQTLLQKMLSSNQNFRRFLGNRHVASDEQKQIVVSLAVDLAQKLESTLLKHISSESEDGFKVLLPAYIQRSVHNAVVDYIRQESAWERQTLQDTYLDPNQDDPRTTVADDTAYTPEQQMLSGEQVGQLNQLRQHLNAMLSDAQYPKEPLIVVDCMFGLGLTKHSKTGEEMTMRECCDVLNIEAETLARRIARCQVLLDKGLDLIRQRIYSKMPGIAECWQKGVNVNLASRRELTQLLGLTEGEIERLIKGRQFASIDELVDTGVIKPTRLSEICNRGGCAVFVPVDVNSATARDITDILGVPKDKAQKLVAERPFADLKELVAKGLVDAKALEALIQRGGVVRSKHADTLRLDLNKVAIDEVEAAGIERSIAEAVLKHRPFTTWAELEEFMFLEPSVWTVLRQRFFLGLPSG